MNPSKPVSQSRRSIGIVNGVLIAVLILLPTAFGYLGKPTEMGIVIAACSIALCFANLHEIQSFKGAGFEAQMREKVEEASATVEALRNLAGPLLRTNLTSLAYAGRWDGISGETEHQLMGELSELVKSLDMEGDQGVQEMMKTFYNLYARDHLVFILQAMQVARIKNQSVTDGINAMAVTKDRKFSPPSGTNVRQTLAVLTDDERGVLEPFVKDYEHYLEHHAFRRKEATSQEALTIMRDALDQKEKVE